jgi:copper oxidase (laccase) domain-containing protein
MRWRLADDMAWIEAQLPGARAAFSARGGGVSEGPYESLNLGALTDDDWGAVVENRSRLAATLDLQPEHVVVGHQVHGAELATHAGPQAGTPFAVPGTEVPKVDGHVVSKPGLAALVFVADCLPVALAGAVWRAESSLAELLRLAPPTPRSARGSVPAATKLGGRCSMPLPISGGA